MKARLFSTLGMFKKARDITV